MSHGFDLTVVPEFWCMLIGQQILTNYYFQLTPRYENTHNSFHHNLLSYAIKARMQEGRGAEPRLASANLTSISSNT